MSKAEEFLREHGHITEMTGNYPHRTEKSYIISDKTLHELMRVFAEQYADEQRRECKSCGQLLPDECPDCEQSMFI